MIFSGANASILLNDSEESCEEVERRDQELLALAAMIIEHVGSDSLDFHGYILHDNVSLNDLNDLGGFRDVVGISRVRG